MGYGNLRQHRRHQLIDARQGANCYGFTPLKFQGGGFSNPSVAALTGFSFASWFEVHDDACAAGADFHEV
jgi:hypothetical protein